MSLFSLMACLSCLHWWYEA